MKNLRLVHLSDLHFGVPYYNFTQFLSKRWVGNLNYLLFRRNSFKSSHLLSLPALFKKLEIDKIFFTGDFTTTALDQEFRLAQDYLHSFAEPIYALPGNHDYYTKESERDKKFYQFFPSQKGELGFSLLQDRIYCAPISGDFYWIALDCAVATPPFYAYGIFSREMEEKLEHLFKFLPPNAKIIMGNHYPLFGSNRPSHDLKNGTRLQALLKKCPNVQIYLHGHDHKQYIIDRTKEGYPLVLNCGSSAHLENGGFFLIDMANDHCQVGHYYYDNETGWFQDKVLNYSLSKS